MNAIAGSVKTPNTAKMPKARGRKKVRKEVDADGVLFIQEAAELMFQEMDQQEAAEARRKTR
jgi:hypothetical protein